MRVWRRVGVRGRLALALAAVAVASVAIATWLAHTGLDRRLDQFARDRLHTAARHSAQLAASLYSEHGRWTLAIVTELGHLAEMNGYRLVLSDGAGTPVTSGSVPAPRASANVVADGRPVGTVTVAPEHGQVLTSEDRALHNRLDEGYLISGGIAIVLGLVAAALIAPALARPVRRLTDAARRMQGGDLGARVNPRGASELRELGQAFNRLAETLEHEERIRRDAAADISHELRTPLAGIVSRIEAAQDGVLADERANLEAMHAESLRLTRLVEDLGKLAEAQQPGLTLQKHLLDLRDLVQQRTRIYDGHMRAKGIALNENLAAASAYGDRGRIAQIIDNLLSNALRYTDAGGTVTVELAHRGGEAILEIADTGIGIAGEDLPYIFERFWRGERSRARRTGGAGIGLAIVRELVLAHGGRIDVESRPGEGSRFRVSLPSGETVT